MSLRPAYLGIDIGGTKLATGVVTTDGSVLDFRTMPTCADEGRDAVLARLWPLAQASIEAAEAAILACGIGCGGPMDVAGGWVHSPYHLKDWGDVPLVELAQAALNLPTVLENDANAAALAEWRFGAGLAASPLLYLTMSTGLGGAVIAGGEVLRDVSGNGAEPGHLTVRTRGRACRCGRSGCLEAYASGTAVAERFAESVAAGGSSRLQPGAGAAEIVEAAGLGDDLAVSVWNETLDVLADGLASLCTVLGAERVVIGGGVTRSYGALFPPLRRRLASVLALPPPVVPAGLGDQVGVVGAAVAAFAPRAVRA